MNIVLIINIFTIVNLTVLGVVLLQKRPHTLHNIVLSVLVFIPAVAVLFNTLLYYDLADDFSIALFLTFNLNMIWSPVFLLYILLMTGTVIEFKLQHLLHLIPLCISLAVITPILLLPDNEFMSFVTLSKRVLPWQYNLVNAILALQCLGYIAASAVVLNRYNKGIKNLFSDIHKISVFWLQGMILIGLILFVTIMPPIIIFKKLDSFLFFLPLGLNCVYLYIVYKTMSSPVVFTAQIREVLNLKEEVQVHTNRIDRASGVTENNPELKQMADSISAFFQEQKPYLNPELNIKMLSELTGIPVHPLSAALNQYLGQNFYDFVNSYRIKYAQRLLSDEESDKYTIETLAVESGFRSRSVFYTAFKKEAGVTPSEYKKDHLN